MNMARMLKVSVAVLVFGMASNAQAQWAVVDVGAIAQLIEQIATMKEQLDTMRGQLNQAKKQYESTTGSRGMERLLSGTDRNYLPSNWQSIASAVQGRAGGSGLSGQIASLINSNSVLQANQLGSLSTEEREQLDTARGSAALMQATTRRALEATSARFGSLQRLIDAIPGADDPKAALELQARIAAEQVMLQNEQTKLMVLYQSAEAEEMARRQRARESAISNIGSLRRLPAIGLNE
jgi:type IV secretion system protein VirB5